MRVRLGLEVALEHIPAALRGVRIGLVTNYAATDHRLVPTIDRFWRHPDLHLTTLFGPEHGVKGSAGEGEAVGFAVDDHTGLPVYSLYGDHKAPTGAMLSDVDTLVIDLQDIGSRYYTNMNTMARTMRAADAHGKAVVVLDRPNPLGGTVTEGNILAPEFQSFVGGGPLPNRHGLTIGELARFFQRRQGIGRRLTVVPLEGWRREMFWEATGLTFVSPSPNTSDIEMAFLYPGMCLFEGTNLSLGRGTAHPFATVGAPFVDGHGIADAFNAGDLPGVRARPAYFVPRSSRYQGELCVGVALHILDRAAFQPVRSAIELMLRFAERHPDRFVIETAERGPSFFQRLAGGTELEHWIREAVSDAADRYLDDRGPAWAAYRDEAAAARLY